MVLPGLMGGLLLGGQDGGVPGAWDLSTATFVQSFDISTEESFITGGCFSPDGTRMYITGRTSDNVHQYSLSTAWNVSTANFVRSFSVAAQDSIPLDVIFGPDGDRMYMMGGSGKRVYEYALTTAWDISTASLVQNFSVNAQETGPTGVDFSPDGAQMYITGTDTDGVVEYDLGTPWDISTAGFVQSNTVPTADTSSQGLTFKPDGTLLYLVGTGSDSVRRYALSTAWDVSTASYTQAIGAGDSDPGGVAFKPDGTKMYIFGNGNDAVREYTLGT